MSRDVIEIPTILVDRDEHNGCNMDLGYAKAYTNVHRIANGPSGPISVALDFLISEVERLNTELVSAQRQIAGLKSEMMIGFYPGDGAPLPAVKDKDDGN